MKHHTCPDCLAQRRTPAGRRVLPILAAGLLGAVLPLAAHGGAQAAQLDTAKKPPFSGYSTNGQAMPMKIEVFEPTIPIPATPQAEVDTGYTTVEADSSSAHARASQVWPGDAVGEGFTTIAEALGLPLPNSVYANGYPVQVNAQYPGDPSYDASEPTPGTIERTGAAQHDTTAELSYAASNCTVASSDPGSGSSSGGSLPIPLPTLPGLPVVGGLTVPGLPGTSGSELRPAAAPRASSSPTASASSVGTCMTPSQLDALVSAGSYVSVSTTHSDTQEVHTTTRAALSDIKLAGGVVGISGVSAQSTTGSDGKKANPRGQSHYGNVTIAGQQFAIGPDGALVGGSGAPIPGLPDDPNAALKLLGIQFSIPKPIYVKDKAEGSADVEGLIVTIDSDKLSKALDMIPFDMILNQLPDLGPANQIKSALQAAVHLSPKYVIHMAVSDTKANTVQPIKIPSLPPIPTPTVTPTDTSSPSASTTPTPTAAPPGGGGSGGGTGTGSSGGGIDTGPLSTGGGDTGIPTVDTPPTTTDTPPTTQAVPLTQEASKLPDLKSVPGLLLYGGLLGGALAGAYVRRLGLAALGDTTSCPHGLNTGLPDLRKA